jgi:hypothetical protein
MKVDIDLAFLKLANGDDLTPGTVVMHAHPGHEGRLYLIVAGGTMTREMLWVALDGNLPWVGYPGLGTRGGFIVIGHASSARARIDTTARAEHAHTAKRGRLAVSNSRAFIGTTWIEHHDREHAQVSTMSWTVEPYIGPDGRFLTSWELVVRTLSDELISIPVEAVEDDEDAPL